MLKMNERLKKIKLLITDVDGVLTDNGLYYTEEGLVLKKFNVKDGMGVVRLRQSGIKTAIISTDESKIIKKRAERLKMDFVYTGTWDKDIKMKEICEIMNISTEETAFIGDDVNDIGIINAAGITACPADAMPEIKSLVDIVFEKKGGEGVFRVVLKVTDMDKAVKKFEEKGVRLVGELTIGGVREIAFHPKDAHGIQIVLAEYKAKHPATVAALEK